MQQQSFINRALVISAYDVSGRQYDTPAHTDDNQAPSQVSVTNTVTNSISGTIETGTRTNGKI